MPGTCLYINPLGGEINMKQFMGGKPAAGQKVIKVKSNNYSLSNAEAHLAAIDLRDKLIANPGTALLPTKVVSFSQGGQFALKCLREWGAYMISNGVNPDYVEFYLAGCPEQPYTGCTYLFPSLDKPIYPGDGTKCSSTGGAHNGTCPTPMPNHGAYNIGQGFPTPCAWKIWFLAVEFDGFADCPANYAAVPALDQRVTVLGIDIVPPWFSAGNVFSRLRMGRASTHNREAYRRFIDDPKAVTFTLPAPNQKVKCVYLPSYPYPPQWDNRGIRYKARNLDEKGRPGWNAAWTTRPISIPLPNYAAVPSWIEYNPQ